MPTNLPDSLRPAVEMLAANRFAAAATWLAKYVMAAPSDARAFWLLAGARMRTEDYDGAERAVRNCIALSPGTAAAHVLLGEILACQSRFTEAESALREGLRLAPGLPQGMVGLARVMQSEGRHQEALGCLAEHPGTPPLTGVHGLRAHSLLALRHWPEAVSELRLAVAQQPGNASMSSALATALLEAGDVRAAETVAREAVARHPDDANPLYALARSLIAGRDYAAAETALREVSRLEPGNSTARINLAEVLWMRHADRDAAIAVLDEGLRLFPAMPELQIFKARILEWADASADALLELEKGLQQNPGNRDLLLAASQTALRLDPGKAFLHAREIVERSFQDVPALLAYGNASLALGNAREAERVANKMLETNRFDGHAIALQTSAWRALGDKRYREICDYRHLVRAELLDVPDGWTTLQEYLADLARGLLRMHTLQAHPIGQTLRGGTQLDLKTDRGGDRAILAFEQAIRGPVNRYIRFIGQGSDALRARASERWALSGLWSVKLKPGGRHVNHYHPDGWLSSACYVHLPKGVGDTDQAGWLQFGEPGFPTMPAMPAEHFVKPEPGLLVLFPAWMWHGTLPFAGAPDDYRLSMAFDVVPVSMQAKNP